MYFSVALVFMLGRFTRFWLF